MNTSIDIGAKKLSVSNVIYVRHEERKLCSPRCRGFIDEVRPPSFAAKCKMFLDIQDLNLERVEKDENGHFMAEFARCQECIDKEDET